MRQSRDPPIAVAPILGGEFDDVSRQRGLVGSTRRLLSLRRTMLRQNPACQSLRNMELQHDMLDTATPPGGAQKFPEAASLRMSFSSVRSETALRNRSFSFSRSFKRFTWSLFRPPNSLRQLMGWTALPPTLQAESLSTGGERQ